MPPEPACPPVASLTHLCPLVPKYRTIRLRKNRRHINPLHSYDCIILSLDSIDNVQSAITHPIYGLQFTVEMAAFYI
jgi:hypothetical protein